jgi:predicted flap endonuclease-1-like 5' DNA nuclease
LHEAAQLLARLTANRLSSLQRVDQRLLVNDRPLQELVLVDQEIVALAVRMACIRTLSNTLGPIPLVIDEAGLIEDASRLVEVLQEFARHDHQVLLFTSRRDVLDRVNAAGGWCGYLERTSRAVVIETPEAPVSVLEYVNRALDVAWREDHDLAYEPRLLHEPARKPGAARADRTGPLRRSSPIAHAPAMHGRWGTALHAIGIKQVGDLLDAHPTAVVRRLQGAGRSGAGRTDAPISSARVRRWQDAARLMCQQPKLRAFDALVLSGCGMRDAAMLQATSPSELADRVEAFLSTGLGRQVLRSGSRFEVARITEWLQSLRRQRGSNAVDGQNPDWHHLAPTQQKPSTNAAPRRAAHLRRESPVERAPTIGPSMARRLNKVGVQTVADLLSAAPEDLAKRLGAPQIAPRVIRQWQAQATLVCQVPGLRGHAAQLLVAAGVTTPNDLARAQAGGLYEAIVKQSKSAAGQRYLRGREAPSREEVTQWVRLAQTRKPRAA